MLAFIFNPATQETEHDLINIESKSEFIAADKDKVRKQSNSG